MPQSPTHPLVRSYLLLRPQWSQHHRAIAVSVANNWHRWLTARGIELVDASRDDCATFITERIDTVAGSTAHKDYQHLLWLYRWLVEEGEVESKHPDGPMRGIRPPKVNDPSPERTGHVTEADYTRLMASFDKRKVLDCRNAAICSLMYWSGVRRSEVVRADLDRLDFDTGTLDVYGKNGLWRTVPLAMETIILLERYVHRRRMDPSPALFVSERWREHPEGRMHPNALSLMLVRRCQRLGIRATPHMFRRAMAIGATDRGISDLSICAIAGWEDPRQLKRYKRDAVSRQSAADFRANDPTARRAQARRQLRSV